MARGAIYPSFMLDGIEKFGITFFSRIIGIEAVGAGVYRDAYELESITVKTLDGKTVEFTAGGYDERYIEWEEIT